MAALGGGGEVYPVTAAAAWPRPQEVQEGGGTAHKYTNTRPPCIPPPASHVHLASMDQGRNDVFMWVTVSSRRVASVLGSCSIKVIV